MACPSLRYLTPPSFLTLPILLLATSFVGSASTFSAHPKLTAVSEGFPAVPDEYMVTFNEGHDLK
jgi:subtilisin family serine protease